MIKIPTRNVQKGFTIIELMITLTIVTILLTVGVPSLTQMLSNFKIGGAAEKVKADMDWARSISIRDNRNVVMTITDNGGGSWCYGFDDARLNAACNCTLTTTVAGACTVNSENKRNNQAAYGGTTLVSTQPTLTFTPRGLLAGAASTLTFDLDGNTALLNVSLLGRGTICSNDLNQFDNC